MKLNRLVFAGLLLFSIISCQSEEKKQVVAQEGTLDFNSEIARLDSLSIGLQKTAYRTNSVETRMSNQPNWAVELKPFVDTEFNRPSVVEKYTKTVYESPLSGWRDVVWVGNDEGLSTKWAIYRFQNEQCIGARINVEKVSDAYQMTEQLTYIPQLGYSIDNIQDLKYINDEQFYLEVGFSNAVQSWRMFFDIGEQTVPVNFDLKFSSNDLTLFFQQGRETIEVEAVKTDSGYYAEMPIFQSYLKFEKNNDTIVGAFHNLDKGPQYEIPFEAMKLPVSQHLDYDPMIDYPDFKGKWETHFGAGKDGYAAIGLFDRLGNDLIGTFATETGDYRFLQGKIVGDSFSLSTFDGSHLFLFTGKINGDQITDGHFYSGSHYTNTWSAKRNDAFELKDPNSMTALQSGVDKVNFTFPDLDQNPVSLSDEQYKGKVVIVQILGSWCPNCMDETKYFTELHKKYNSEGLEIIGLSFERSKEFEKAKNSLSKAIEGLHVPYKMLIAGTPKNSGEALPMITEILSYPTSIILDKNGDVIKIHTGFYGPGTGEYYKNYTKETEELIKKLLSS